MGKSKKQVVDGRVLGTNSRKMQGSEVNTGTSGYATRKPCGRVRPARGWIGNHLGGGGEIMGLVRGALLLV